MCVDEAHRGKGIGGALPDAAKDWARKRGLTSLCLAVWTGNQAAEALYRRHGFQCFLKHMELGLVSARGNSG